MTGHERNHAAAAFVGFVVGVAWAFAVVSISGVPL
jgi:hypothetical protein